MSNTTLHSEPSLAMDWSIPQTASTKHTDDISLQAEHDMARQRFRRFLIMLTLLIGLATLVDLTLFAISRSPDLYPSLILDTFLLSVIGVTWWFYRRNQVGVASLCLSATAIAAALFVLTQYTSAAANGAFIMMVIALAPTVALPYVSPRTFRRLGTAVAAVGTVMVAYLATLLIEEGVPTDVVIGDMFGAVVALVVVLFLLWQFSHQQHSLVARLRERTVELEQLQAGLERQVIQRTAALQSTLLDLQTQNEVQERLLTEIRKQQSLIQDLSVPVLPITPAVLVLPLIGTLDHNRLELLRQRALEAIEQSRARTLVLDVTGVPALDQKGAQGLLMVAQATRIMGSQCVLAGLRPELAQALVQLGMDLRSLRTYATLQRALDAVTRYAVTA